MEPTRTVDDWRSLLRARLIAAMKARDTVAMVALRSMLGAIDNAEAADAGTAPIHVASAVAGTIGGSIAGGVVGLGAGEVARRDLSITHIDALLRHEATDRRAAAGEYRALGQTDAAAELDAEALVIDSVFEERSLD